MKRSLGSRLDRHFAAASALAAAAAVGGGVRPASAAIVYSGPVNINIPSTTAGVYLNVVTGVSNADPTLVPGYDVDPWSSTTLNMFAPTTVPGSIGGHVGGATTYYNLTAGTVISGASTFSANGTATIDASTPLNLNSSDNLVGFRFYNENTAQTHYGWLRISLSGTVAGQPRAIVEYAYEDAPGVGISAGATASGPTGACCIPSNLSCGILGAAQCTSLGGTYNGDGSTCAAAGCPTPGACCNIDGTCSQMAGPACTGAGGVYSGNSTSCGSVTCPPGACCYNDGTCASVSASACTGAGGTFRGVGVTCGSVTCEAGGYGELEPNETRPTSNPVNFVSPGNYIHGNTTGAATTAGPTSLDQFLVRTPAAPLGIYRNRLTITTTGAAGHTGTIRGLGQTGAVAGPWPGPVGTPTTTDSAAQTSSTTSVPARMNQWYGFGKQEQIYYRVTGTATTTGDYLSTWTMDPVTPVSLGNFQPGSITISTYNQGHSTDTDLWVYDGDLNAIQGYGNDGGTSNYGGAPTTSIITSWLTRTYAPGTYYLAMTTFNLANNQGSPCDDDALADTVLDFPNAVLNSSTSTGVNVAFAMTDSAATTQFAATRAGAYDIQWFRFTVGGGDPTCYANCDHSTALPFLNVQDFSCFLTKYASGDAYANCDGSTQPPVLNVQDFSCFLTKYAGGCSAP